MASAGMADNIKAILQPHTTIILETKTGAKADPSPIDARTIPLALPWNCGKTHRETPWAEPG